MSSIRAALLALAVTLLPLSAHAYVGPGAGMGAIAVTIAVLLGLLLLVVGFLWYPLKRMLKKRKAGQESTGASET